MKDRSTAERYAIVVLRRFRWLRKLKKWNSSLFATVVPMVIVVTLVMMSQVWADALSAPRFLGLIGLMPQRDPSYFFGMIHALPVPVIKAVALTAAIFATFLYTVLQWAIPTPSPLFRMGLSWILGASLGAAANRAMDGYVTSYFVIGMPHLHTPPLNVGDFFIMTGAALALAGVWINTVAQAPDRAARGGFWVNPRFQLRYCGMLIVVGGSFSAVLGGCGYLFLQGALEEAARSGLIAQGPVNIEYLHEVVRAFGLIAALLSTTFLAALGFIGLVHSHRIAGPVYAFELFVEDLFRGKLRRLKFRDGDEFAELEKLGKELGARLGPSNNVRPLMKVITNAEESHHEDTSSHDSSHDDSSGGQEVA